MGNMVDKHLVDADAQSVHLGSAHKLCTLQYITHKFTILRYNENFDLYVDERYNFDKQ